MLTLTTVDIDRDQNGEQRVHYLIKRAIGSAGDTLRVDKGEVFIKPDGLQEFLPEKTLMKDLGLTFRATRLVAPSEYTGIEAVGIASAYQEVGLPIPAELGSPDVNTAYKDAFGYDMKRVRVLSDMNPSDARLASTARRYYQGWYIPSNRIFPMGDNRDNSRDGRYFGPVDQSRVLGRALFKYWPPSRVGVIP
jgi:signal peptidase I